MTDHQCFCGDSFPEREDLIAHNVTSHEMSEAASRQAVDEKYPRAA